MCRTRMHKFHPTSDCESDMKTERWPSCQRTKHIHNVLLTEFLCQRLQLPTAFKHSQNFNLEFRRGLLSGVAQFRDTACDGCDLSLCCCQVACQNCLVVGGMGRL